MKHFALLTFLFLISGALANFDRGFCTRENECVVASTTGPYCFKPNNSTRRLADRCEVEDTQNAMRNHIASSTSIGYYHRHTFERLGDHTYVLTAPVFACFSGRRDDGTYESVCDFAETNNQEIFPYCAISIGQPNVNDGCYTPDTSAAAVQFASGGGGSAASSTTGGSSPSATPTRSHASRLAITSTLLLVPFVGILAVL